MIEDASLGARVQELAMDLDLPEVDLRAAVLDGLGDEVTPRRGGHRWLLVAAAVVAALVVGTAAIAPARDAVADWLGIGSTSIRHVPGSELPEGVPAQLGEEVPVGSGPSPLPGLGEPAAAFRDDRDRTSYVWRTTDALPELDGTGWGAILSTRSAASSPQDVKLLAQEDEVVAVMVGRAPGLWIPGDHIITAPDQPPTTAHYVLLWIAGPDQYRLETELPLEDALALAESVEGTEGG